MGKREARRNVRRKRKNRGQRQEKGDGGKGLGCVAGAVLLGTPEAEGQEGRGGKERRTLNHHSS